MTIKILNKSNYKKFTNFLQKNVKTNHIFTLNKKLFDWIYYDLLKKKYNFYIYISAKKKILATKGFQPISHFDNNLKTQDFFFSMWYSIFPTAGIKLFNFILKKKKFRFIGGMGFSKHSYVYQKYLGFNVGEMKHSYQISNKIKKFKIAYVNKSFMNKKKTFFGNKYINLDKNNIYKVCFEKIFSKQIPTKSKDYLLNRYINHPKYKYIIYGSVLKKFYVSSVVVLRKCFYKDRCAIKIVDFIGFNKNFKYFDKLFFNFLQKKNIEYIDLYSFGLPSIFIKQCGFKIKNSRDKNIIPNFFEPLLKSNVSIKFGFKCKENFVKQVKLFRGDSDMDRPNIL